MKVRLVMFALVGLSGFLTTIAIFNGWMILSAMLVALTLFSMMNALYGAIIRIL